MRPEQLGQKRRYHQTEKISIGTRMRLARHVDSALPQEAYRLTVGYESIQSSGSSPAGVYCGAQTLCQTMSGARRNGGYDLCIPSGVRCDDFLNRNAFSREAVFLPTVETPTNGIYAKN